jgi:hypothetical protein
MFSNYHSISSITYTLAPIFRSLKFTKVSKRPVCSCAEPHRMSLTRLCPNDRLNRSCTRCPSTLVCAATLIIEAWPCAKMLPFVTGACAFTILNCHISDKRRKRAEHVAGPFLLCILGLAFTIGSRARSSLIGVTFTGLV